jgi:hypothetical protein
VLGVVAALLKADRKDLSCANLNMARRTLRAETMRTLWDTIHISSRNAASLQGGYGEYKELLQRTLKGEGAKYIRYVDHLRSGTKQDV